MVYFGFDDALTIQLDQYYKALFDRSRKNPNGCPISMSLYVQDQWTNYGMVNSYFKEGFEIGSHSVTHTDVDTEQKMVFEAGKQKDNLTTIGRIPRDEVVGWRSPNLKPAGDAQPQVLKNLGYTYDISLTYTRFSDAQDIPWPFTLDYGYPYQCSVIPCPGRSSRHSGFWEILVPSLYNPESGYPCAYVDSCRPTSEAAAVEYLWINFQKVYQGNRAPFGLNMHAAWFMFPDYLKATHTFIRQLLQLNDVYIVTAKQVLDWMRHPVKVSEIHKLPEWGCGQHLSPDVVPQAQTSHTPTPTTRPAEIRVPTVRPPVIFTRPPPETSNPLFGWPAEPVVSPSPRATAAPTTTARPQPAHPTPMSFIPIPSNVQAAQAAASGSQWPWLWSPAGAIPARVAGGAGGGSAVSAPFLHPILVTFSRHAIAPTGNVTETPTSQPTVIRSLLPLPVLPHSEPLSFAASSSGGSGSGAAVPLNSELKDVCVQEVTCKSPSCTCRSLAPPASLPVRRTPQIIYLTITGAVDNVNYPHLNTLLKAPSRHNPNGCPITATFFLPGSGSHLPLVQSLRSSGNEIAAYGAAPVLGFLTSQQVLEDLVNFDNLKQQTAVSSHAGVPVSLGYKSPAGNAPGSDILAALNGSGVTYDSSLVTPRITSPDDVIPWPYTLDYGWKDCTACQYGRFPGLWEVPIVPLMDYKQQFVCTYADGCNNHPPTTIDTYNFFDNNLMRALNTNRAPMGIHLRREWFTHPYFYPNLRGLEMFLDAAVARSDVYVVSVSQMLDWMRTPVPLTQATEFQPWQC